MITKIGQIVEETAERVYDDNLLCLGPCYDGKIRFSNFVPHPFEFPCCTNVLRNETE